MSRTIRQEIKGPYNRCMRRPRHKQEESKLLGLLTDTKEEDFPLAGRNRIHKRLSKLPNAWDDILISALFERI